MSIDLSDLSIVDHNESAATRLRRRARSPKKEVAKKPDPKKIFEGAKDSKPAKAAPKRRKRRKKKPYPT